MTRLVLIDGNAILHRAYHALPPLTTPDGTLVNAVYGFVSMLIKIWNDFKPTHMAVAFDRPEPTFRKKMFIDYQAKRPEMDRDLVTQIPKVQDVVRAFGIPIYEAAGFEADDVIGTLCRQIPNPKHQIPNKSKIQNSKVQNSNEIIIVTGDKDILQLVDERVKVFMPTKGLSEGKLYGEKEVEEKLGVAPKQIPDLKALMGDSSDNYPGIAGIGPKTAVGLIARYGNIDKIYGTVNSKQKTEKGEKIKLSVGIREKLRIGEESARMSKDLATIRTDVPVEIKPLVPLETLDTPEARKKLQEFHFPSLVKRLAGEEQKNVSKKEKVQKKEPATPASEQQQLF